MFGVKEKSIQLCFYFQDSNPRYFFYFLKQQNQFLRAPTENDTLGIFPQNVLAYKLGYQSDQNK